MDFIYGHKILKSKMNNTQKSMFNTLELSYKWLTEKSDALEDVQKQQLPIFITTTFLEHKEEGMNDKNHQHE